MATRFEIVLHGDDSTSLRAAGEEALAEAERLEAQLSIYQPTSEIARVNARAALEPVRVTPEVFGLLEHALRLGQETKGAFDVTIGPLMRCWSFMGDTGRMPDPDALAEARARVGMHLVQLDPANRTVRFARSGVVLDLGAIGKGYAVECAANLLREAGVTSALIHGGTSTIHGIGHPPGAEAWKVAIERPSEKDGPPPVPVAVVPLIDEALSVSAIWGKSFQSADQTFGHVIDPCTGQPVQNAVLAAVALPSATETDALSTALLTLGDTGRTTVSRFRPGARMLVMSRGQENLQITATGITCV